MLRDAREEITAFADFPEAHWRKVWSTNPLVIWSPFPTVLHVRHEANVVPVLRRGPGYLPPSMRQMSWRSDAGCSGGGAGLAA